MPAPVAVTPTYATGDLSQILEIEERQIEDTLEDLSEAQAGWRPHPKAKSAIDILWHLTHSQIPGPKPGTRDQALAGLREAHAMLQRDIATPGKLDEPFRWWTGDTIPYRGVIWAEIRHRTYHLGELVYLRQVMGLDEPKYYHEE